MIGALLSIALLLAPLNVGDPVRTIRWSHGGITHAMDVRPEGQDLQILSRPDAYLRTAIGPLVAVVHRGSLEREGKTVHRSRIETQLQGRTEAFDLIGWLDESGQSGMALRQLVEARVCDTQGRCASKPEVTWSSRPDCPSAEALEQWDGGFVEMANVLIGAQCVPEAAVQLEPGAFWVDDWDGRRVTLAVQRDHCDASPKPCNAHVSYLQMTPPASWRAWLSSAIEGQGHVARLSAPTLAVRTASALPTVR